MVQCKYRICEAGYNACILGLPLIRCTHGGCFYKDKDVTPYNKYGRQIYRELHPNFTPID